MWEIMSNNITRQSKFRQRACQGRSNPEIRSNARPETTRTGQEQAILTQKISPKINTGKFSMKLTPPGREWMPSRDLNHIAPTCWLIGHDWLVPATQTSPRCGTLSPECQHNSFYFKAATKEDGSGVKSCEWRCTPSPCTTHSSLDSVMEKHTPFPSPLKYKFCRHFYV